MKTVGLVVTTALLWSGSGFAQEDVNEEAAPAGQARAPRSVAQEKENVLYVAPFSLLWGGVVLEYERALSPGASLFVAPALTRPFGVLSPILNAAGIENSGYGATVGARFYFTGKAPGGLFVGPELNVNYLKVTFQDVVAQGVGYSLGGTVGYSLITDAGFSVSLGLGLNVGQLGAAISTTGSEPAPLGATPPFVLPSVRFHVGWAF